MRFFGSLPLLALLAFSNLAQSSASVELALPKSSASCVGAGGGNGGGAHLVQRKPAALPKPLAIRGGGSLVDSRLHVLFYWPNLLGYVRLALLGATLGLAPTDWLASLLCYTSSFVLDGLDGILARALHQTSRLGVVLDMVTDRLSTAVLLVMLAGVYPNFMPHFAGLMALDIGSHWFHMYRSQGHHKAVGKGDNPILRAYYGFKPLFLYSCVAAEALYIILFALKHVPHDPKARRQLGTALCVCMPGFVFKQIANVAQLFSSMSALAVHMPANTID